jgi:hypothetical protein
MLRCLWQGVLIPFGKLVKDGGDKVPDFAQHVREAMTTKPTHPPGRSPMNLGNMRELSVGLLAVAACALTLATSAEAITLAPLYQPEGMIAQIAYGCGTGKTRVGRNCMARTTVRHTRRASRAIRRCIGWDRGVCAGWH